MTSARTAKRSPLKAKPLRVAGQSLDEAIQKIVDNDVDDAALVIALLPALAFFEWARLVADQMKSVKSDVWVLSAKALPDLIEHEPRRLGPEDINLISFHLSRYMRSEIRS